ncbi:hypothetical protein FGRMN_11165 [Fusarium graminum]|nr:hypothetical protein FGRMN_11165 [Fusarium graminum]
MITGGSSSSTLDKLLASLQSSETSAESEEKRNAFARLVSEEFGKSNMAMQAASSPSGAPAQNGLNGANTAGQLANHSFTQTPVPLPSYAPPSLSASATSGAHNQASSASPAQPTPFVPPGQHRSPPMQPGTVAQVQAQDGNAMKAQSPQQTQAQGLVSPQTNQQTLSVEALDFYKELVNLVEKAPASAVRQVVRDKWEKSLTGSQYHIAFLLNATMHQASSETIAKAVQEFGAGLVKKSKRELMGHLTAPDLDELADLILPRVSPQFLDKALARRLETIPARQLVNALARAERLGYDVQDIVQEHNEHVIPSLHSIPTTMPPAPLASQALHVQHYQPPPVASQRPLPKKPNASTPTAIGHAPQMALPPGPPGLVWCRCGWPCSSGESLEYVSCDPEEYHRPSFFSNAKQHLKKNACRKVQEIDIAGRDICLYCGCRFGSGGGLLYHEKSHVCGEHTYEMGQKMRAVIDAYRAQKRLTPAIPAPPHQVSGTPYSQMHASSAQPQMAWATSTPSEPTSTPGRGSGRDPYSHLDPKALQEFNEVMKNAEEKYGGLMKEAMLLAEPERSKRLAGLKNSYNTKQSTTRKKYGIRLRERRTRGEIEAEEARLIGTPSGNATPSNGTPIPDSESRPKKRPRTDGDDELRPPIDPDEGQGSPRKRVTVAEMGGLSGSQATAELTDPTAHLNPTQPRYVPSSQPGPSHHNRAHMGATQDDPMSIDDDDDSSDSDSDSDGDIPASVF